MSRYLVQQHPREVTAEWNVDRRRGKVFADYNQNVRGKTLASIYSPRVLPWAAVSMPIRWDEVGKIFPTDFTLLTAPDRLRKVGDLWAGILDAKHDLAGLLGWSGTRVSVGAVIVPGYGQTSEQPIVRAMAARLAAEGVEALPISFSRKKPTEPFAVELDELRRARDGLKADQVVLIGRSFGGRVCTRLAAAEPPGCADLAGASDRAARSTATRRRSRADQRPVSDADRAGRPRRARAAGRPATHRSAEPGDSIYVLQGVGHNFGRRTTEGIDQPRRGCRRQ